MSSTSSTDSSGSDPKPSTSATNDNSNNNSSDANFECNICLDTAKDAVVSMCGHLFWYAIKYSLNPKFFFNIY